MKLLITGGLGFIGSGVIRHYAANKGCQVLNVDKATYAANPASLLQVRNNTNHQHLAADIADAPAMARAFAEFRPDAVIHLAAESHVDRSIDGPAEFIHTNLLGTFVLLQAALEYWRTLEGQAREAFRFLHVSTDEVFGSLGAEGFFSEDTPYRPNSPYSASKAGADHLARAWHKTYGMPVLITNCSNNYGPCQFPEKLIPLVILRALRGEALPVYGRGDNIRDWLYVEDHVRALARVLERGQPGRTYNIGGHCEHTNLDVVHTICALMDERVPGGAPHAQLINFVKDRPGHDFRYAMNPERIASELDWTPQETFHSGMKKTVDWYLDNRDWWQSILDGSYRLQRLGMSNETGEEAQH